MMHSFLSWATAFTIITSSIHHVATIPCLEHSSQQISTSTNAIYRQSQISVTRTSSSTPIITASTASASGYRGQGANGGTDTAEQPALLPAVHWNHDKGDYRNLAPMNSHNLYYSAHGVSGKLVHPLGKARLTLQTLPSNTPLHI